MILRLVLFAFSLLLSACHSNRCNPQQRSLVHGGILYFRLADARTGELLWSWSADSVVRPRYALDSARVYRHNNKKVTLHDFSGIERLGFVLVSAELDSLPLHTDMFQRYFFYPSRSDADTIDVHYVLQQNDCDFREYRTIHILYNHTMVYADSGVSRLPTLTFRK